MASSREPTRNTRTMVVRSSVEVMSRWGAVLSTGHNGSSLSSALMLPFGKRARSSVKRSVEVARVRINYRCFHRDSRKSMVTMKFSSLILLFFSSSSSSFFIESIETLSLRRERNVVVSIDYVNVNGGQWEQKNWTISLSLRSFTRELLWKRKSFSNSIREFSASIRAIRRRVARNYRLWNFVIGKKKRLRERDLRRWFDLGWSTLITMEQYG